MDWGEIYHVGGWIAGVIAFLIVWIGCSVTYGFLGFALGWIPAYIIANIVAAIWPLLLFGIVFVVIKLWN